MSGLLAIYRRDGGTVAPEIAARLLAALDHRGRDGSSLQLGGDLVLGCQSLWTTPEEVGEEQPLSAGTGGDAVDLIFDGRLDNRRELLAALDAPATPATDTGGDPDDRPPSDAALLLRAYRRWGTDCFARLLGPFAAVVSDHRTRRVVCARDPLGARPLVYHLDPGLLVAASEERAVLAHPEVSGRIDEESAARFFAILAPRAGRTFYAAVAEVPPGHLLEVGPDHHRLRPFRELTPGPRLRYRTDDDYAEHFRELLAASVACRLRSTEPPAVLMSGGLDSTSLAALAAAAGAAVRTVSWTFDELRECDERRYIDAVVEHCGLTPVRVAADGGWPLRGGAASWPRPVNGPLSNPYRLILDRAYRAAREAGSAVLLTSWFGDELYAGAGDWWLDLVADRRWAAAARELFANGHRHGGRPLPALWSPLLRRLPGVAHVRRLRHRRRPAWLTPAARRRVAAAANGWSPDAHRRDAFLAELAGPTAREEAAFAAATGLDLRTPYRDRRLVEFALALPAHQLYRPGSSEPILRRAVAGLLPEVVRLRRDHSSLTPLFARGVAERERDEVRRLLYRSEASWPRHVRADWVSEVVTDRARRHLDDVERVVPWHCVAWELWRSEGGRRTLPV